MMRLEVYETRLEAQNSGPIVVEYHDKILCPKAKMAVAFAEKWGMALAEPDGEDTAGRQQHKVVSPANIAQRACDMVDELYLKFNEKGWVVKVPDLEIK